MFVFFLSVTQELIRSHISKCDLQKIAHPIFEFL